MLSILKDVKAGLYPVKTSVRNTSVGAAKYFHEDVKDLGREILPAVTETHVNRHHKEYWGVRN
jgi:hypothetical protein